MAERNELAGRVKSANQLTLRWEDYPWLSPWARWSQGPIQCEEEGTRGRTREMQHEKDLAKWAGGKWRRGHVPKHASGFEKLEKARALWILPVSLQKRSPDSTLLSGQWDPQWTSDLQSSKVTDVRCFKTIKFVIIVLLYHCIYTY